MNRLRKGDWQKWVGKENRYTNRFALLMTLTEFSRETHKVYDWNPLFALVSLYLAVWAQTRLDGRFKWSGSLDAAIHCQRSHLPGDWRKMHNAQQSIPGGWTECKRYAILEAKISLLTAIQCCIDGHWTLVSSAS